MGQLNVDNLSFIHLLFSVCVCMRSLVHVLLCRSHPTPLHYHFASFLFVLPEQKGDERTRDCILRVYEHFYPDHVQRIKIALAEMGGLVLG